MKTPLTPLNSKTPPDSSREIESSFCQKRWLFDVILTVFDFETISSHAHEVVAKPYTQNGERGLTDQYAQNELVNKMNYSK